MIPPNRHTGRAATSETFPPLLSSFDTQSSIGTDEDGLSDSGGFRSRPIMRLKAKCYVYDHRHEKRLSIDITVRAKAVFRERGMLRG